jgi:hypothetical protein
MTKERLEDYLESPGKADFYDVLGGLSDNLMTVGSFAGSFMSCEACGKTFSLRRNSWKCSSCGQAFDLHFDRKVKKVENAKAISYAVDLRGVHKSGINLEGVDEHWFLNHENWCVARWLSLMLRLPAEGATERLLGGLGIPTQPRAELQTVMSWPRLILDSFAKPKTVQPDVVIGRTDAIVFFEFKRPKGGTLPPTEVLGQLYFAGQVGHELGRDWFIVVVPGNAKKAAKMTAVGLVGEAREARADTLKKWRFPDEAVTRIDKMTDTKLAGHIRVLSWEDILSLSLKVARDNALGGSGFEWNRRRVEAGLLQFWQERADKRLLEPPTES